MLKQSRLVVLSALALGLMGSSASADVRISHGSLCEGSTASDAGRLGRGQFGIHNESASVPTSASCGGTVNGSNAGGWYYGSAYVYDRSPVSDVCCTFMFHSASGALLASGQRCTTGSSPNVMFLSWGAELPSGNFSHASVHCVLPQKQNGALSHLSNYFFTTP
jgi:hypothetical protein